MESGLHQGDGTLEIKNIILIVWYANSYFFFLKKRKQKHNSMGSVLILFIYINFQIVKNTTTENWDMHAKMRQNEEKWEWMVNLNIFLFT